jgi:adenosylcobinamide-GDP ribazoletransferase
MELCFIPRGLRLGLSFLTRLIPAQAAEPQEFTSCLAWFPVTGLILGGLLVLPWSLGLTGNPWLSAWILAGLSAWATRGLHLDGLADIADAWGSGAEGEKFWAILKDSRVGAFGVMGLVLAVAGQIAVFGTALGRDLPGLVIWSFVLGRTAVVVLAWLGRDLARPGLGRLFAAGATGKTAAWAVVQALVLGWLLAPAKGLVLGCLLTGAAVFWLWRLAKAKAGLNGDFFGAVVVIGEIAACLGGVI